MVLNPLLAYPREVIDPGYDAKRDEGEARARLLRPALHMGARGCPGLCSPDDDGSIAAAIAATRAQRVAVHMALFKADAEWKPRIALVAPTTKAVVAATADTFPEDLRIQCVPVKGDESVAVPNYPREGLPAAKLTLDFSRRCAGHDAHVQCKRDGVKGLKVSVFVSSGARKDFALKNIDARILERLFTPPVRPPEADQPLPAMPGELPIEIASAVADFWQRQMRAHVIPTVCAPDVTDENGWKPTRPLAFESIVARREGSKAAPAHALLRATFHPSSLRCACPMHGLPPMARRFPSERFVDSSVDLTLAMCGRKLQGGICPLHQGATPTVPLVPSVCCHGTVASLGCSHATAKKRRKSGMWIPDMALDGLDLVHAQALLEASMRCVDAVEPLLGKRPREAVDAACRPSREWLACTVDEIERKRAVKDQRRSAEDMLRLDMLAVDMLRKNDVRRHVRPSTKQEVLAREGENADEKPTPLGGEEAALSETHLGLFRPAVRHRRGA